MTDEIPQEFSDEEKWFKFFPKSAFLVLIAGTGMTILAANVMKAAGMLVPAAVIGGLVTAVAVAMIMIPKSEAEWLRGGGQSLMRLIIKRIIRRTSRKLYVLGYGRW